MQICEIGVNATASIQLAILKIVGGVLEIVGRKGFGRITELLGQDIFGANNYAIFALGKGGRLKIYLHDYYWSRLVLPWVDYEPELRFVLSRVLSTNTIFIDCGANIGYWSSYATAFITQPDHIVAIEAGSHIYKRLTENQKLNDERFIAINAAVDTASQQEREFTFYPGRHAGSHLRMEGDTTSGWEIERVQTIAIDDVLKRIPDVERYPIVVKLDVEGAEIAALKGATTALKGDILIIYEDHGADDSCRVTGYIMQELGYHIFFPQPNYLRSIGSLSDLRVLKRNKRKGYNLIACAGRSRWLGKIQELTWSN